MSPLPPDRRRTWLRWGIGLALCCTASVGSAAPPAGRSPSAAQGSGSGRDPAGTALDPTAGDPIVHMRLEGALENSMLAYLERVLDEARARDARLLLEIDTPGGQTDLMWRLATALSDASREGIGTVAWVNDKAMSAGALLAIACDKLYMRPHATIGSALLVRVGPGGLMPVSEDEDVREKLTSDLRSDFRAMAAESGRPAALAEAMVDPNTRVYRVRADGAVKIFSGKQWDDALSNGDDVQLLETIVAEGELFACTGTEGLALGLTDGLASSIEEVVEAIGGGPLESIERRPSEELAGMLYQIWPLLLFAGLLFGYLELKAPGFGVFGILAIACFAVMLGGRWLVGLADVPHIVLIVAGLLLVAVEIFVVPGTVWVGLLGGLLGLAGLTWSLVGGVRVFDSDFGRSLLLDDGLRVAASAAVAALAAWGLSRVLPRTPLYRHLALVGGESVPAGAKPYAHGPHAREARVGAEGRTLTALRLGGKVMLDAAPKLEYEARSDGFEIPSGTRVRVVEVLVSGRLIVSPVPAANGARERGDGKEEGIDRS